MAECRKLLFIDADENYCKLLRLYLTKENFETVFCENFSAASELTERERFYAVILDPESIPEKESYIQALRESTRSPLVILTKSCDTFDKITMLNAGADDYLVKPCDVQELIARMQAINRRSRGISENEMILVGKLAIDKTSLTASYRETLLPLPLKEVQLLAYLAEREGQPVTRAELALEVWQEERATESRTIDMHINRLRKHLYSMREFSIESVWNVGYRFVRNK